MHLTTTLDHSLLLLLILRDESLLQPVSMFTQVPSCAPSAPGLETTGSPIGEGGVAQAMGWEGIIGLGEMMNFPGVVAGDPQMLAEIAATNAKLDALGLVLDSDPRRVTKTGSAQTGDPAADPAADDPSADAETDPAQADQQD